MVFRTSIPPVLNGGTILFIIHSLSIFLWEELWTFCVLWSGTASLVGILILRNKWECEFVHAGVYSLGLAIARWSIFHPASPQASQHCGFCRNKWSLVTVREDYYNLIIGLALMVHSVLLREEKEYSPCPLETAIQMRREEIEKTHSGENGRGCKFKVIYLCILIMMKWQQLSQQRSKFVHFREEVRQRSFALFQKSLSLICSTSIYLSEYPPLAWFEYRLQPWVRKELQVQRCSTRMSLDLRQEEQWELQHALSNHAVTTLCTDPATTRSPVCPVLRLALLCPQSCIYGTLTSF